jgi:hypothetical protein
MTDYAIDASAARLALGQLMNDVAAQLDGRDAFDVLAVAGFLATRALRCLPPGERMDTARSFGANVISSMSWPPDVD